jgi:hypothetical protein
LSDKSKNAINELEIRDADKLSISNEGISGCKDGGMILNNHEAVLDLPDKKLIAEHGQEYEDLDSSQQYNQLTTTMELENEL